MELTDSPFTNGTLLSSGKRVRDAIDMANSMMRLACLVAAVSKCDKVRRAMPLTVLHADARMLRTSNLRA
jgi:hypothetical protein